MPDFEHVLPMLYMLRRLVWRTLVLMLLLTGGMVVMMQMSPLPAEELQGLGWCGNPCWLGIEPGETAFDQVPELVKHRQPERVIDAFESGDSITYLVREPASTATVGSTGAWVSYVQLESQIPLWRLLVLLDAPVCIRVVGDPQQLVLAEVIWEKADMTLLANIALESRNTEFRTNMVALWLPPESVCDVFIEAQRWPGFLALLQRLDQN